MLLLRNEIKPYAWGSHRVIAELQRREPSATPEAELWMGTHPSGPSLLADSNTTLAAWVSENPSRALGTELAAAFQDELPYLFKVLAAAHPLSLQAHPSKRQAELGFVKENTRGIALSAKNRIYKDRNHKPELVCALEPFEALYGFRQPFEAGQLLRLLVRELGSAGMRHQVVFGEAIASLDRGSSVDAMRCFLEMPSSLKAPLTKAAAEVCARLPGDHFAWVPRLEAEYPGDVGSVISLLLNYIRLAPGEALYLPAGNLHAYLRGAAVELMANSDNVLRAGLTPKHVDANELISILDPRPIAPLPLLPVEEAPGLLRYDLGARCPDEFELWRVDLVPGAEVALPEGPTIVLATTGDYILTLGSEQLRLVQGTSCFLSAEETTASGPAVARLSDSVLAPAVLHCASAPITPRTEAGRSPS